MLLAGGKGRGKFPVSVLLGPIARLFCAAHAPAALIVMRAMVDAWGPRSKNCFNNDKSLAGREQTSTEFTNGDRARSTMYPD